MDHGVYERMAEIGNSHWWFEARRDILATLIEREVRLPADARIIEIGCGPGQNLPMLKRFGHVEACELDPYAREIASKRLGAPVREARLPDLSAFDQGTYDLVALLDVLEHVDEDAATLDAIRGLLKPGGTLLLTVPANPWMFSSHDVAHHHKRRYRKAGIAQLAKDAGFETTLLSPFNTLLFPLVAAARLVGKVTGREGGDDAMPSAPVNAALKTIFGAERAMVGRLPMPFGVSLVALLKRPAA